MNDEIRMASDETNDREKFKTPCDHNAAPGRSGFVINSFIRRSCFDIVTVGRDSGLASCHLSA